MRISKRLKQKNYRRYQQEKKQALSLPKAASADAPISHQTPPHPTEKPLEKQIIGKDIEVTEIVNKTVAERKNITKPQTDTPFIPIRNQQNIRFILISLLLVTISSFWLMQNSINAYYQQTYHRNSPLAFLDKNQIWSSGAKMSGRFNQLLNQIQSQITAENDKIVQWFNHFYAYTPEYRLHLQREVVKRQAIAAARNKAANQQAKQNKQKADFTLNNTDEVFFAGDSLMQGVAPHVQKWLSGQYGINSVNLSKQSTGLAYPRFFDWPKTIHDTLAKNHNIKILVVYLGPNDPWDMPNPKGGDVYLKFQSPQWAEVYRQRIRNIIQSAKQRHVTVLWLMPPSVRKIKLNQQLIYLRQLMANELSEDRVYIMDTSHLVGSHGAKYSDTLLTDGGQRIKTRSADGIHFSLEGQKIIAHSIFNYFNINN